MTALALVLGLVAAVAIVAVIVLRRRVAQLEGVRRDVRRALIRLGDALGATDDRAAVVSAVLEAAQALVGADEAVFWLDTASGLTARAERGTTTSVDGQRLAIGDGLVGRVGRDLQPATAASRTSAEIAVPVLARGRLYGVLSLHRHQGRPFSEADVADLLGIARQAEAAVDGTFVHEEARHLSLTDGLTGLWNRRQFELRVAQELERAARFGERFSIVMVDLDSFKQINDTHGHLVGDTVLVETAERLVEHTREVDTVARFGGEEFVLLLPQTDVDGAHRVAEKVRAEVAGRPIETDAGPLTVTLSAGVSCHPVHGATLHELLASADDALYAAKTSGKNRVVLAADEVTS